VGDGGLRVVASPAGATDSRFDESAEAGVDERGLVWSTSPSVFLSDSRSRSLSREDSSGGEGGLRRGGDMVAIGGNVTLTLFDVIEDLRGGGERGGGLFCGVGSAGVRCLSTSAERKISGLACTRKGIGDGRDDFAPGDPPRCAGGD